MEGFVMNLEQHWHGNHFAIYTQTHESIIKTSQLDHVHGDFESQILNLVKSEYFVSKQISSQICFE